MNKMKEPLSITQKYTIRYIVNGASWLLYSIFNLFSAKPIRIIAAISLLICAICSFYTIFAKQESDDEMSLQHILVAKSISLNIILCSIMLVGILSLFFPIPFKLTYGFFVAGAQLVPGLLFLKYEKEGY